MDKYFIAMLTNDESESNLYYVKDDFSISKIKNDMTPEVYDKETLEDAKQELESLVRVEEATKEIGVSNLNTNQMEALKTAISTINDILMLYKYN